MQSQYHLFVCDTSGEHAPICVFVSDSPFPTFIVGDRFDDQGWHRLDGQVLGSEKKPIRFIIHSIKHIITTKDNMNIIQTGLNLQPFDGNRSPAFDSEVTLSWTQAIEKAKSMGIIQLD